MGSHVGNTCQLQQALHSAVFTVFTVEHRKYHIDPFPDHAVTLKAQQALTPDRRNGSPAVLGVVFPFTAGEHCIILSAKEDPVAVLGNTYREHIILAMINIVQHSLGRPQGDLMLRTHAAEQNAYAEFFHIIASFTKDF